MPHNCGGQSLGKQPARKLRKAMQASVPVRQVRTTTPLEVHNSQTLLLRTEVGSGWPRTLRSLRKLFGN
jgi:hypothetical protein